MCTFLLLNFLNNRCILHGGSFGELLLTVDSQHTADRYRLSTIGLFSGQEASNSLV